MRSTSAKAVRRRRRSELEIFFLVENLLFFFFLQHRFGLSESKRKHNIQQ